MNLYFPSLVAIVVMIGAVSVYLAPSARSVDSFFRGRDAAGAPPGAWTLTLSQVTTWIFARSLLNAGILGYFFGIAGALAYTAYYGSFLTGWLIVDRLRFHHGVDNIQTFLAQRFGRAGTVSYNVLVSLRLLSEVFANLLVVGIVFSAWGAGAENLAILAIAGLTLAYSMAGGLHASLRTDVWQMGLLIGVVAVLTAATVLGPEFSLGAMVASSPEVTNPGWILLAVALLQVLGYPLHDPVMMDRGFLAERQATRRSFLHAFWISSVLILAFGLIGVFTGLQAPEAEDFLTGLELLLGSPAAWLVGLALLLSAISTMDSTLSSVSKLAVVDAGLGRATLRNGRIAMALFAVVGLLLVYFGTDDLFAAVAISGTASMFLTPVIVYSIFLNRDVARWSLITTFLVSVAGAALYFLEDSGRIHWIGTLTGFEHSYAHLLVITVVLLITGFACFALGLRPRSNEGASGNGSAP